MISGSIAGIMLMILNLVFLYTPSGTINKKLKFDDVISFKFLFLSIASLIFFLSYWLFNIYLAPYSIDAGFTPLQVSILLGVVGIVSTIGRISMGFLTDKYPVVYIWICAILIKAIASVILVLSTSKALIIVICIVGGIGHAGGILLPQVIPHYFNIAQVPAVYGLVYSIASIGSIVGPIIAGTMITKYGYVITFGVLQSTSLIAILFLVLMMLANYIQKRSEIVDITRRLFEKEDTPLMPNNVVYNDVQAGNVKTIDVNIN